jgi:phospholipase C
VISPWARHHFVDHTQYEFGSLLKLAETVFRLPSLNARDVAANDMLGTFDFSQAPQPALVEPGNFVFGTMVSTSHSNGYGGTTSASPTIAPNPSYQPVALVAVGIAAIAIVVVGAAIVRGRRGPARA